MDLTYRMRLAHQATMRTLSLMYPSINPLEFDLWIAKVEPAEEVPVRLGTCHRVNLVVWINQYPQLEIFFFALVRTKTKAEIHGEDGEKIVEDTAYVSEIYAWGEGEKVIEAHFDPSATVCRLHVDERYRQKYDIWV